MAYHLSDGESAHFYSLLSDPLRIEYSYLLLSLFTLKLITDGGITNDFKSPKQISGIGFRNHFMCLIRSLAIYMNIL